MKRLLLSAFLTTTILYSFAQSGLQPTDSRINNPGAGPTIQNLRTGGKLIDPSQIPANDGKVEFIARRWWVFEKENETLYWENVWMNRVLIQLEPGVSIEHPSLSGLLSKYGISRVLGQSKFPELQNFYEMEFPGGNRESILALCKEGFGNSLIHFIEPSPLIKGFGCTPNDPMFQWGPYTIGADSVWCYYTGPTKQWIAVIDDAVYYSHPDLNGIVAYGWDYANNDGNPAPEDPYEAQHGTHVSGIVGARINNGQGIAGMVNDTVYFGKVTDGVTFLPSGGLAFLTTAIVNAINDIATIPQIRTYNMSFGASSPSNTIQTAITTSWNNGKLPIAAAGNDAVNTPYYPAGFSNVVAVSAVGVNLSGNLISASYSNYGSWINVSAPGGETATGYGIEAPVPTGYDSWQGTSMASPHVTAVAGIIFDANPLLTNTAARTILESQVWDLGSAGFDNFFGTGMVCAYCAFFEACSQFNPTITAAGSTSICAGGSVTLNAPANPNLTYQWKLNGGNINGATSSSYIATQTGNYTCFIQTLAGCQNTTGAISVTNGTTPTAGFSSTVNGGTVSFTNNSTAGTTLLWNFGDGNTSTSANPSHTYGSPGTYTVTLTATNGCGSNTFTSQVTVMSALGVAEDVVFDFSIYPNPVADVLTLNYTYTQSHALDLRIYNGMGQTLWTKRMENISGTMNEQIDFGGLTPGVYLLEVSVGGRRTVHKIVRQ